MILIADRSGGGTRVLENQQSDYYHSQKRSLQRNTFEFQSNKDTTKGIIHKISCRTQYE